jgi:hypothetical protein
MSETWAGWDARKLMVNGKCAYVRLRRDSDGLGFTVGWEHASRTLMASVRGSRRDALDEMARIIEAERAKA